MTVSAYWYSDKTALVDAGLPPPRANINLNSVIGTYTAATGADLDTDDCIQMVKIPKGATILETIVAVRAAGLDTSTGCTWSLGDTDSTDDLDRYITVQTVGQSSAGGVVRMNNPAGHGYKFTADGTIDITIVAGASTNVATAVVTLVVIYSMAE